MASTLCPAPSHLRPRRVAPRATPKNVANAGVFSCASDEASFIGRKREEGEEDPYPRCDCIVCQNRVPSIAWAVLRSKGGGGGRSARHRPKFSLPSSFSVEEEKRGPRPTLSCDHFACLLSISAPCDHVRRERGRGSVLKRHASRHYRPLNKSLISGVMTGRHCERRKKGGEKRRNPANVGAAQPFAKNLLLHTTVAENSFEKGRRKPSLVIHLIPSSRRNTEMTKKEEGLGPYS